MVRFSLKFAMTLVGSFILKFCSFSIISKTVNIFNWNHVSEYLWHHKDMSLHFADFNFLHQSLVCESLFV